MGFFFHPTGLTDTMTVKVSVLPGCLCFSVVRFVEPVLCTTSNKLFLRGKNTKVQPGEC